MKKILFYLMIMLVYTTIANAQTVGEKAPEIKISKWMKSEPNMKGKKVFLEFWATWCGPCKQMIPHLNEMCNKYSKDLVFVSITKEKSDLISEFMKKTEMKANIAIDDNGKTNTNYGIKFIPQAFLINENGIIDWVGHPGTLPESAIADYIKTGKVNVAPETPAAPENDAQKNLIYGLTISKSNFPKEQGTYSLGKSEIQYINLPLKTIVEMILDSSPLKVELSNNIPTENLDIYYRPANNLNYEQYKIGMLKTILNALNLEMTTEKLTTKVYKINCLNCQKFEDSYQKLLATSKKIESKFDDKNDKWNAQTVPVSLIIRYLETTYKKHFVDNTNLKGYYDFELSKSDLKTAISELEKMGFGVSEEEAQIEIIKINPISGKTN